MCWRESKQGNNWLFIFLSITRGTKPRTDLWEKGRVCFHQKPLLSAPSPHSVNYHTPLPWPPVQPLLCSPTQIYLFKTLCWQLHSLKTVISAGFHQQLNNSHGSDSKMSSERGREIMRWVDNRTEIQHESLYVKLHITGWNLRGQM